MILNHSISPGNRQIIYLPFFLIHKMTATIINIQKSVPKPKKSVWLVHPFKSNPVNLLIKSTL